MNPRVQTGQHRRRLTVTVVSLPPSQVDCQFGYYPFKTHAACPSGQLTYALLYPLQVSPLFRLTRFNAAAALLRPTAISIRQSVPERAPPSAAAGASPLRFPLGAYPCLPAGVPIVWTSGAWLLRDLRSLRSPSRSGLRTAVPGSASPAVSPLSGECPNRVNPLRCTTMPSADFSLRSKRRPFRRYARPPQVRVRGFHRTAAGFTSLALGRWSFAVCGPLSPARAASYPVLVHRLAVSLPASFSADLAVGPVARLVALRFVWVAATCFPEDFHLLSTPMLGTPHEHAVARCRGHQAAYCVAGKSGGRCVCQE